MPTPSDSPSKPSLLLLIKLLASDEGVPCPPPANHVIVQSLGATRGCHPHPLGLPLQAFSASADYAIVPSIHMSRVSPPTTPRTKPKFSWGACRCAELT